MSSSLLSSKYLNKLDVNRLQVNQLKVNEVLPKIDSETKSYLYSAILNNVEFKQVNNNTAELILKHPDFNNNVIAFTDRPFTQSNKITVQQFVQLFLLREPDSFEADPPNVVLIFNNTQKSYTMSLANFFAKEQKVIFNLKLLEGEEHTQDNFTGTINMFVDNSQTSGEIANTGVNVGNIIIGVYYTAKYNGDVTGSKNIITAKKISEDTYKLYDENNFNFAIWLTNINFAYFNIGDKFYETNNIEHFWWGGSFNELTEISALPPEAGYSFD